MILIFWLLLIYLCGGQGFVYFILTGIMKILFLRYNYIQLIIKQSKKVEDNCFSIMQIFSKKYLA